MSLKQVGGKGLTFHQFANAMFFYNLKEQYIQNENSYVVSIMLFQTFVHFCRTQMRFFLKNGHAKTAIKSHQRSSSTSLVELGNRGGSELPLPFVISIHTICFLCFTIKCFETK